MASTLEPKYEEFWPRTTWNLSNAFTSAFKELDPIPQFQATAKLGEFLGSGLRIVLVCGRRPLRGCRPEALSRYAVVGKGKRPGIIAGRFVSADSITTC
jgi:hypothetical protein